MSPFGGYDYLVYIVPGAMILITLMVMLPPVKAFFGTESIGAGGLGIFLIIAFILGLGVNAVADLTLEKIMIRHELAYSAHALLRHEFENVVKNSVRTAFVNRLKRDFPNLDAERMKCEGQNATPVTDDCREVFIAIVRRAHTTVKREQGSDRLEVYLLHYAVSKTIAAALVAMGLVLIAIFEVRRRSNERLYHADSTSLPSSIQVLIVFVIAASFILSIQRMKMFDRLFAEELFTSFAYPPETKAPEGTQAGAAGRRRASVGIST